MLEKINENELLLYEVLNNPVACSEILFSDVDNLGEFNEKNSELRLYQLPFLSFEYSFWDNPNLDKKANFRLRENVGSVYNFSGRLIGKSLVGIIIDILISYLLLNNEETLYSSIDFDHVQAIMEKVCRAVENHPILNTYVEKVNRNPYFIIGKNGFKLRGINLNIKSKSPGKGLVGKHVKKHWLDETSYLTEEVYRMAVSSKTDYGMVERHSSMTNFTRYMVAGAKYFYDKDKQKQIINLPQFIKESWDERERKEELKKYGGEETLGWKVYVEGKVVETGVSAIDMERVRKNSYQENKALKHFEVSKEKFLNYQNILILERPHNAGRIWFASDIGEDTTEIIIISEINKTYYYKLNITLHSLIDTEIKQVFDFVIEQFNPNLLAVDNTGELGKVIYRYLEKKYGKEHTVWVAFNENIRVDFKKDEKGNTLFKKGVPLYRESNVKEWGVKRIKDLLYTGRLKIPVQENYKFDNQFNSIITMQSGNRVLYRVAGTEDHLFDTFIVFAIEQWSEEFHLIHPIQHSKRICGGV